MLVSAQDLQKGIIMLTRTTHTAVRKTTRQVRSGFTLMEIMVVVAIIVILAGAATYYGVSMLGQSKESTAKINITTLTGLAETYRTTNEGNPPASLSELAHPTNGSKPLTAEKNLLDPWGKPYGYDPSGPHNGGLQVDIWATTPEGKQIGNWMK
jgi:general secretion pathway protein G